MPKASSFWKKGYMREFQLQLGPYSCPKKRRRTKTGEEPVKS